MARTSRYFEQTLFYERSPAADEYYHRLADVIFEKSAKQAKIEVRIQSPHDLAFYVRQNGTSTTQRRPNKDFETDARKPSRRIENTGSTWNAPAVYTTQTGPSWEEDNCSLSTASSCASSTAVPMGLDQHRGVSTPPSYPGPPKLTILDLDTSQLHKFLKTTKNDFRVFYIRQRNSFSRIQVTRKLFELLLETCHVFPKFHEYVICFRARDGESEVAPPPLRYRPLYATSSDLFRGFECAYILRYVEFTNRGGGKDPWSPRQFAVYHKHKPETESCANSCSTWILVGASQKTEERLDQYTRSIDNLVGSNPLELHVIFLDTAIASWRPYLVDLTEQVLYQSNKAVGISIRKEEEQRKLLSIEVEDHQKLKEIEDRTADLMLCLDSTSDTIDALEAMYDNFRHQESSVKRPSSGDPIRHSGNDAIITALREKAKEVVYTRKKTEVLLSKVQNTRTLISSLLESQTGHTLNQQILALHNLEKHAEDENAAMRDLAKKSGRDSSSMRILTIIFLIYLPSTVVSNFYSTQFVSQQESESGSGNAKIVYSQNYWLFFAISVPLTVVTIFVWLLWSTFEKWVEVVLCRSEYRKKGIINVTKVLRNKKTRRELPLHHSDGEPS